MDDLKTRYRDTFSRLGPSQEARERILNLRSEVSPAKKHYVRRLSGVMAAAVLMLALLGCAVVGTVYGNSIQSWFAHRWETASGQPMSDGQAAVIDHLSQDIGLSQTVDGVTVTVDSATVGDDTVFLLLRVEGQTFSKRYGYGFDQYNMEFSPDPVSQGDGGMGSYGVHYNGPDGDGSLVMMMRTNYGTVKGFLPDDSPLTVELKLTDLKQNGRKEKLVAEGIWSFTFDLDRSGIPAPVPLPDRLVDFAGVGGEINRDILFTNIEVTNTGIRFRYRYEGGTFNGSEALAVILMDGTRICSSSGVSSMMEDGETLACSFQWVLPVNLKDAVAIQIGDTEIPFP